MDVKVIVTTAPHESWSVLVRDGSKVRTTYFKGDNAQRLAYEYAAGVLGNKPDEKPKPFYWVGSSEDPFRPDPFLAAYAKAVASAPPSPWISVKERLPNRWCLVVRRTDTGHTFVCYGCSATTAAGGSYWMGPTGDVTQDTVTHWMPLPEPPKE